MKALTFQKLNRIAEEVYVPSLGVNPFDALLMPLLGEKELKLAFTPLSVLQRLLQRFDHLRRKYSYKLSRGGMKKQIRKADLVFFITEPTHQKQCLPIARELLKKGNSIAVISTKFKFNESWKQLKVPYLYLHPDFARAPFIALSRNDQFLEKIETELDEKEFKTVKSKVNTHVLPLLAISAELKKYSGDPKKQQWFFGNDLSLYGRIAAQTMRRCGHRTLSIQHGTIPDDAAHSFHLVDVMMVFGQIAKKRLLEKGIPESRICITGAPYTDELLKNNRRAASEKILDHLKLESEYDKRVLIVFSGPGQRTSEEHHTAMISAVLMLAQQFSDYEFIFKLHRKDKAAYYLNAANGIMLSNVRLVSHDIHGISTDIFDWFTLVPLIITGNSAAGSEALLMGKTVFTLDFMNEYKGVDYRDEGVSIHASSEKQLLENFFDYSLKRFGDELLLKTRHFNESYFYKTDGNSALRCAELIMHGTEKFKAAEAKAL